MAAELFKRMAGIEMTHVPYRGAGQAINDLIPGRVDVMFNTIGDGAAVGQERPVARARGDHRLSGFRRRPTCRPSPNPGCPDFDVSSGTRFFAPAKTPPAIMRKMHADTSGCSPTRPSRQRLEHLGVAPESSTPAELAAYLKAEMDKWGPVIKEAGISVRE